MTSSASTPKFVSPVVPEDQGRWTDRQREVILRPNRKPWAAGAVRPRPTCLATLRVPSAQWEQNHLFCPERHVNLETGRTQRARGLPLGRRLVVGHGVQGPSLGTGMSSGPSSVADPLAVNPPRPLDRSLRARNRLVHSEIPKIVSPVGGGQDGPQAQEPGPARKAYRPCNGHLLAHPRHLRWFRGARRWMTV